MNLTKRPVALEAPVPRRQSSFLAPFRYRDYRLLWSGLIVSNLGTWMQLTTLGYLVVTFAGTARMAALDVGILGASAAIPVLLLSPLAGVVADRFPRRRVLLVTNSVEAIAALTLAILTSTGHLALWEIFVIAGTRSTGQSFDAPARQSWVPLLVPREYLGNAIGLNSVAFNAPSVVGPPIAGLLILYVGAAASFYLNAMLTLATVVVVLLMTSPPPSSTTRENVFASILAGVRFLATHPVLRSILPPLLASCLFVRPYQQLMPAYAKHVLGVDARGLGFLLGAVGIGAICGSLVTAFVGARRRGLIWFVSACVMAGGSIGLGFVHAFAPALGVLACMGLAAMSFTGSSNVLIQSLSPADMRGRAISVFAMIVLGGIPAGSLLVGTVATFIGLQPSLALGGATFLAIVIVVWSTNARLRAT